MKNIFCILFIIIIIIVISCTKKTELNNEVIQETYESIQEISDNTSSTIIYGYINNDNLRIRSEPNISSEILGILNTGDCVLVNIVSDKKEIINNLENFWYNITTDENVKGWIFGEYIEIVNNEIPSVFENINWHDFYGELMSVDKISIEGLIACSWQRDRFATFLFFSNDGYYAKLSRSEYPNYGKYILNDNTIWLFPPIDVIRFAEDYAVNKLSYSNEMYYFGNPVLKNDDDSVVFYAHESNGPKIGEVFNVNQYVCERIDIKGKVKMNGYLFALPNRTSKNYFLDYYYGSKATEVTAFKVGKTTVNGEVWYYTWFDFTSGEPTDGGGPFWDGWLPEDYFEY